MKTLLIALVLCVFTPNGLMADDPTSLANQLENRVKNLQTPEYTQLLQQPNLLARQLNDAPNIHLMHMRPSGVPVYYATLTADAADAISTDEVWPGGSTGLALDGSGTVLQLAMWDGGDVRDTHEALNGRVFNQDVSTGDCHHPTMVAGILAAAPGFHPDVQGMSYASNVIVWDLFNDDAEMVFATTNGILLSNHSYEIAGGWRRVDGTWYWFGDITVDPNEDYGFGYYGAKAQAWDQIAYDYPNYFIQKGCGNDRGDGVPGVGESHAHWDPSLGWVTATDTHGPDGGATGFDSVSWFGNAKNIVSVGATEELPGGYTQPSDVVVTNFSSFGPCDDGRIKPDVVANGANVTSTGCDTDDDYDTGSGTSYAGPTVTGSANLLRILYESRHAGTIPRAATLKAVILHTADEAGPADGPDYQHGWGLMNTANAALRFAPGDDSVREASLAPSTTDTWWMSVPSSGDLRVTIVWTDPPGTPASIGIDPPTPMLVNDLDLRLTHLGTGTTYLPWTLDGSAPTAPAVPGDNTVDNVERVDIAYAPAGFYKVTVSHKGALDLGPQAYSIVAPVELMDSPTAVDVEPSVLALRASPNPAAGHSRLSFALQAPEHVTVRILDLRGRVVRTLVRERMEPGTHRVMWSGDDDQGTAAASGVYLALLETESTRRAVKVTLTR